MLVPLVVSARLHVLRRLSLDSISSLDIGRTAIARSGKSVFTNVEHLDRLVLSVDELNVDGDSVEQSVDQTLTALGDKAREHLDRSAGDSTSVASNVLGKGRKWSIANDDSESVVVDAGVGHAFTIDIDLDDQLRAGATFGGTPVVSHKVRRDSGAVQRAVRGGGRHRDARQDVFGVVHASGRRGLVNRVDGFQDAGGIACVPRGVVHFCRSRVRLWRQVGTMGLRGACSWKVMWWRRVVRARRHIYG